MCVGGGEGGYSCDREQKEMGYGGYFARLSFYFLCWNVLMRTSDGALIVSMVLTQTRKGRRCGMY